MARLIESVLRLVIWAQPRPRDDHVKSVLRTKPTLRFLDDRTVLRSPEVSEKVLEENGGQHSLTRRIAPVP